MIKSATGAVQTALGAILPTLTDRTNSVTVPTVPVIETGSVIDLEYRADHPRKIYNAKIVDLDDKGVMIFAPTTHDHQWFPYTSIIRMIPKG